MEEALSSVCYGFRAMAEFRNQKNTKYRRAIGLAEEPEQTVWKAIQSLEPSIALPWVWRPRSCRHRLVLHRPLPRNQPNNQILTDFPAFLLRQPVSPPQQYLNRRLALLENVAFSSKSTTGKRRYVRVSMNRFNICTGNIHTVNSPAIHWWTQLPLIYTVQGRNSTTSTEFLLPCVARYQTPRLRSQSRQPLSTCEGRSPSAANWRAMPKSDKTPTIFEIHTEVSYWSFQFSNGKFFTRGNRYRNFSNQRRASGTQPPPSSIRRLLQCRESLFWARTDTCTGLRRCGVLFHRILQTRLRRTYFRVLTSQNSMGLIFSGQLMAIGKVWPW